METTKRRNQLAIEILRQQRQQMHVRVSMWEGYINELKAQIENSRKREEELKHADK